MLFDKNYLPCPIIDHSLKPEDYIEQYRPLRVRDFYREAHNMSTINNKTYGKEYLSHDLKDDQFRIYNIACDIISNISYNASTRTDVNQQFSKVILVARSDCAKFLKNELKIRYQFDVEYEKINLHKDPCNPQAEFILSGSSDLHKLKGYRVSVSWKSDNRWIYGKFCPPSTHRLGKASEHGLKFWEFAQTGKLTDISLRVGQMQQKVFQAHKSILVCHSSYFEALLSNPTWTEENERNRTIREIEAKIFEWLLKYIYTGELELFNKQPDKSCANEMEKLNIESKSESDEATQDELAKIYETLAAAHFLGLNAVVEECVGRFNDWMDKWRKTISAETFALFLKNALQEGGSETLIDSCLCYVCENPEEFGDVLRAAIDKNSYSLIIERAIAKDYTELSQILEEVSANNPHW